MSDSVDSLYSKVLQGSGILFVGQLSNLGLLFLARVIVGRSLGTAQYGAVAIGLTILSIISMIVLLGVNTGIARYLPRSAAPEHQRSVILSGLHVGIPLSLLAALALFLLANPIATVILKDPSVAEIIRIFSLGIPFAALMHLAVGVLQGLQLPRPKVLLNDINLPLTHVLFVGAAVFFGWGQVGVSLGYTVSYGIAGVLSCILIIKYTPISPQYGFSSKRRELLKFSFPLVATAILFQILVHFDTFMIAFFMTTSDVGIYNAVYPITRVLLVVLGSFRFMILPVLSEVHSNQQFDEMRQIYQMSTKWILFMTLPIFLFITVFSETTIELTFGSSYLSGATALSILATGYFFDAIVGPNRNTLTSIGNTWFILGVLVAVTILNVLLNLLLIPTYGITGAAIATAIAYGLLNIAFLGKLRQLIDLNPFSQAAIKPTLYGLIVFVLMYRVVNQAVVFNAIYSLTFISIFAVIFTLILIISGGIESEDRAFIARVLNRY